MILLCLSSVSLFAMHKQDEENLPENPKKELREEMRKIFELKNLYAQLELSFTNTPESPRNTQTLKDLIEIHEREYHRKHGTTYAREIIELNEKLSAENTELRDKNTAFIQQENNASNGNKFALPSQQQNQLPEVQIEEIITLKKQLFWKNIALACTTVAALVSTSAAYYYLSKIPAKHMV